MKHLKHILYFLFLFLWLDAQDSHAQAQQIKFNLVEGIGEISLGKITSITQDVQGYMWFADQDKGCITRYDGYSMVSYRNDPFDPNSLGGTYPETLTADSSGILWIGFYGMGLDRFDPETGTFTHYKHDPNDPASLSNDSVTAIVEDHLGNVWVANNGGLDLLDQRTGTFKHLRHIPGDPSSLSHNRIRSLYEDKRGTLWVGTGVPWEVNNEGGLNKFDRQTGRFTRYKHDPQNPQSLGNNKVRAIFEDSRGTFWIGTAGEGLYTMDREKGVFTKYRSNSSGSGLLGGSHQKFVLDHVTFIVEDVTGAIWIGRFESGLNRYDPATKTMIHFRINDGSGFADNSPWQAFSSREGVLWISTQENNLYRIDPLQKNFSFIKKPGSIIQSFYEDDSGKLWIGAMDGIYLTGMNKKIVKKFTPDAVTPLSYAHLALTTLEKYDPGQFWVSNGGKLFIFNPKTASLLPYKKGSLPGSNLLPGFILCFFKDRNHILWIGGSTGLYYLDPNTGNLNKYVNHSASNDNLDSRIVFCLLMDNQGDIWAGTLFDQGLYRINRRDGKLNQFLKGKTINCLFEDSEKTLWVGTKSGLYRREKNAQNFSVFNIQGSPINTAEIAGLVEDNDHNLWVSSKTGIFRINRQHTKIIRFSTNYNIRGNELTRGIYKMRNGEILISAMGGYYSFFPSQFRDNLVPPQIVLHDFKISDQLVKPGKDSPLKHSVNKTTSIKLNYKQNAFSLGFAGIHFSSVAENTHLYRLEGFDQSWRRAGSERTASYLNVPPGKYIFRVKVSNSEDVWAERSFSIEIVPAWWKTWWFMVSAFVCITTLIFFTIRWRMHRKFRQQLEHSKKERQLAELKQKTIEMEMQALRAQMNPHFIFNSLNSINRFILQNNKAQASEYLTKFSKLVRMILQNSQASLIPLESELESLQLYLELEAVRFDHHFEFRISVEDELDADIIKVPPLIIQPYAENAIWHGLMNKEEKGHLEIELFQQDDMLCCKITDDGIGRKKAAELKSKSGSTHKSMGMKITTSRIEMLQQKKQLDAHIKITDLVLADGSAGGTEVMLKIPIMQ